jgi:hypothetical protein
MESEARVIVASGVGESVVHAPALLGSGSAVHHSRIDLLMSTHGRA